MRHQAELLREASLAKVNSYSPYSNFRVGAAALLKDGSIIKGCNIENASYGLSMCAERVCLYNVYSQGYVKDDKGGWHPADIRYEALLVLKEGTTDTYEIVTAQKENDPSTYEQIYVL